MSRGVRDLRDLICVSRLTIRDSDEEFPWDDEDEGSQTTSDGLSSEASSRQSSAQSRRLGEVVSPDSGIGTNGHPDTESVPETIKTWTSPVPPPAATRAGGMRRKRKKKTKGLDNLPKNYDLPKPAVLPPVKSETLIYNSSSSDESVESQNLTPSQKGNFDDMLTFIDATVISEWLAQSNANVTDLAQWCHAGDNFVQFAHFWLTDFSDLQKQDLFKLETSIILDQLSFAFRPGRDTGSVKHKQLVSFLDAVFREYPGKLLSSKGPHLFLDILSVLSSERKILYKKVLTDVKISTRVKQHAQWCLAIRSFTLVSVWSAVVNFYRRLLPAFCSNSPPSAVLPREIKRYDPTALRLQQTLRCGYVDVLNYLIQTKKIPAGYKDEHKKTLLFSAVMLNQSEMLHYLLSQTEARLYVNDSADNGNTPLHAAANSGNSKMTAVLLGIQETNVNVKNPQCDGATPLHLATMHGHCDVVRQLLVASADTRATMGDLTALTMAKGFGHEDIVEAFRELEM